MPRPRKLHLNNTVLFVTTSVEQGIIFPQNPLIQLLLKSAMARAQEHFPVIINHFIFEATHVHFIFTVDNPDNIKGFMERFKTESAHYINKLLGRKKRTIWQAGYDSPILPRIDDVVDKIIYLYENPSKDNLANSIEEYIGLNSFEHINQETAIITCPYIKRTQIEPLQKRTNSFKEYQNLAENLIAKSKTTQKLILKPNAWMNCFKSEIEDKKEINQKIIELLKLEEEKHRQTRITEKKIPTNSNATNVRRYR